MTDDREKKNFLFGEEHDGVQVGGELDVEGVVLDVVVDVDVPGTSRGESFESQPFQVELEFWDELLIKEEEQAYLQEAIDYKQIISAFQI